MLTMKWDDKVHCSQKRLFLSAFMMAIALCVCGCAKDPVTMAESVTASSPAPATSFQETTSMAQETMTTNQEPSTKVLESTTTISESTTEVQESIVSNPANQEFVRRRDGEIISMLPLSEIPYSRPDMDGLFADMDALATQVKTSTDIQAIVSTYKDIIDCMINIQSMNNLAYFRYCQDPTDSYYSNEYDYISSQSVIMDQKHNNLLQVMADSTLRTKLENAYFGRRYFDYYVKEQNETYQELTIQENELLSQFYDLTETIEITYQGKTKSLNEWMEHEEAEIRDGAQAVYIETYHEPLGKLFLKLLKVRHQLALSAGYKDYMSYTFHSLYYRDYSLDRAKEFLDKVKTHLVPIMKDLYEQKSDLQQLSLPAFRDNPLGHLASAAEVMGGIIEEAYHFMDTYNLCDANGSSNRRMESYTSYLPNYEAPIIFASGNFNDLSHEFGHFVDLYCNYGSYARPEINETFSTTMEYLSIVYDPSLDQTERADSLRTLITHHFLNQILETCAFTDFEIQVYTGNPDELTLEILDEMYYQCRQEYGIQDRCAESVERGRWIYMDYFFTYPGYLITYPIANISGLQIYFLETTTSGAGLEAFCRMLKGSKLVGIETFLRNAKLNSPFASETIVRIAEFLRVFLELL